MGRGERSLGSAARGAQFGFWRFVRVRGEPGQMRSCQGDANNLPPPDTLLWGWDPAPLTLLLPPGHAPCSFPLFPPAPHARRPSTHSAPFPPSSSSLSAGVLGDLHSFDPATMIWMLLSAAHDAPRPTARSLHGFTSAGGRLYVHGGYGIADALENTGDSLSLPGTSFFPWNQARLP